MSKLSARNVFDSPLTGGKPVATFQPGAGKTRNVAGAPIELVNATHAMNRTSTWPKFAPFIQGNGNLVFFTFSSRFAYGFLVPDRARPQIWMSAIDLDKEDRQRFEQALSKKLGRKVTVTFGTDPGIVGGAAIQIGDPETVSEPPGHFSGRRLSSRHEYVGAAGKRGIPGRGWAAT